MPKVRARDVWTALLVCAIAKTNEAYISDGYRNRRVIVFDGTTGKYLRHWVLRN